MKSLLQGAARTLGPAILRRLGAIAAAYAVAQGIPADMADQLVMAGTVFLGLLSDSAFILWQSRAQ